VFDSALHCSSSLSCWLLPSKLILSLSRESLTCSTYLTTSLYVHAVIDRCLSSTSFSKAVATGGIVHQQLHDDRVFISIVAATAANAGADVAATAVVLLLPIHCCWYCCCYIC
jgi:hypothetical protein